MSQRNSGRVRIARDAYNTEPWATNVLVDDLEREGLLPMKSRLGEPLAIWECAAGAGLMSGALAARGYEVYASDIEAKPDHPIVSASIPSRADFLTETLWVDDKLPSGIGAIITNPPYSHAYAFIGRALDLTERVQGLVAMLLRADFDSAGGRRCLFGEHPAWCRKIVLTDRIEWFEDPEGRGSPSENHAWFVWKWRGLSNDLSATIGYGGMPPELKAEKSARRAELRRAAAELEAAIAKRLDKRQAEHAIARALSCPVEKVRAVKALRAGRRG